MPIQTSTLNHYLSTPEQAVRVPGGRRARWSRATSRRCAGSSLGNPSGPLGALCRPDDPADVARGIRSILEMPPAEPWASRLRCLAAAHDLWNWETEFAHLVALYADLRGTAAGASAAAAAAAS